MKTLLRYQKFSEMTMELPHKFRRMANLRMIFVFITLSLSGYTFSQSIVETNDQPNLQNTAGTFQFESPSGTVFFWKMDFIESLYPGIESRRALEHNTVWHFSPDMDIIIFAKNMITSSDFVPLESPYNGPKEFKY